MITLAVVENNNRHLNIITTYISANPKYKLLATAANGFDMLRYCHSSRQLPDIALVDIEMEVMDGISLIDYVTRFFPAIKCIVNTGHHHKEMCEDAMACGAMGIISKVYLVMESEMLVNASLSTQFESFDNCIDRVMKNEFCIEEKMAVLTEDFSAELNRNSLLALRGRQLMANEIFGLTEKEWELAALCSTTTAGIDEIGALLSLAPKTIQKKLAVIYQKLAINNRMELVRFCSSKTMVKHARELLGRESK